MRATFRTDFLTYQLALIAASLVILLFVALRRRPPLTMRLLQLVLITPLTIILLSATNLVILLDLGSFATPFLIYLLYSVALLCALASLCAIANSGEFNVDLVFAIACGLFCAVSFAGQRVRALIGELLVGPAVTIIAISYAFVALCLFYIKWISATAVERAGQAREQDRVGNACDRLMRDHHLTPREREILRYLAEGHNGAYVSEVLFISPNTVRTHVHNIYRKLHVSSREDILRLTRYD
jgi:DNA-binding CsgD family transcriptional regulator